MTESVTEPVPGATEVVEAATAERALEEVHARLGGDARILEARRVLRGGVGGFFAREVVELHAAPATPASATPSAPAAAVPAASAPPAFATPSAPAAAVPPAFATPSAPAAAVPAAAVPTTPEGASDPSPFARLLEGADEAPEAMDFATFLRQRLQPDTPGAVAPAEASRVEASPVEASPVGDVPTGEHVTPRIPDVAADGLWTAASVAALLDEQAGAPDVTAPDVTATDVTAPDATAPDVTATAAHPASPIDELASEPATVDGSAWSAAALLRLGLPVDLVRSLRVTEPVDDLAWTTALASALRLSCRPLPTGDAVLAGPNAATIGAATGQPAATTGAWLSLLRPNRWLHVVAGGDGWRAALAADPLAVSWSRDEDLPDAIRCAIELGLVLGYGPVNGDIRRARPLDVALTIRDLVEGR